MKLGFGIIPVWRNIALFDQNKSYVIWQLALRWTICSDKQELLHKIHPFLQGVFIYSWSQQPWNLQDHQHQEAVQRETGRLWTFTRNHDVFPFRTIEDVLVENQEIKNEIMTLLLNISELTSQISALSERHEEDIGAVREDIQLLTVNVESVGTVLETLNKTHYNDIQAVTKDIDSVNLPAGWT